MTIRFAKGEDYWRKTFERPYSTRYESLAFENLRCVGQGAIAFTRGITAIVGGNGVGKSTLISAVAEVLQDAGAVLSTEGQARVVGSRLTGRLVEGDAEKTIGIEQDAGGVRLRSGDELNAEASWLEPAYLAYKTRAQVIGDENFDDLLESLSPIELAGEELGLAAYITGKEYTSCSIFEIEEYGGFERFPYFRVAANGQAYDTKSMGQGELALLVTLWMVRDLTDNSILVLEEPETHVSPRSQSALMTFIASQCAKKGLWVIVTTHSPVVIKRIPRTNVRLLVRDGGQISIVDNPHRHQVASILGGAFGYEAVLLVEDNAGKYFALALLEELDADLARQFEIVPCGSDGQVIAATKSFPRTRRWLSVIGALDGDQRDKEIGETVWPVTFLPGNRAPEALLKECLDVANGSEEFAALIQKTGPDVAAARQSAAGMDIHDWLITVGRGLGLSQEEMIRRLATLWLRGEGTRAEALGFVENLRAAFDEI
jgi:predicted ATPase